ncbi:putative MFS family arabinose efflux permease [Streptomyces sp. 1114.5]|uniref:MFS transporter n=1 Tax=Streptomyces sp. 1114.5 TaxID=1938830 RepID=UPI000EB10FF7|nr:MFS transporter [Streptomyces sp. 1114.5]RKT12233.1 putative MFS family arabinose efflux permease [Streptomyces sp. 1114.5]
MTATEAAGTAEAAATRLPLVLRNRRFAAVWAAQVLTQAAGRMFQVGAVWWLVGYAAGTDRGLASGVFLAVSTLPAVALAPLVAALIARRPHRTVLGASAAVAGLVALGTAGWTYAATLPMAVVYGAALLLAGCQAVFDPCLTTSVPELVEDADIEAATGFELATQSLAGLAGGLLGPLVVDGAGLAGIVAGCAGAYLLAAALIAATRFPTAPGAPTADGDAPADDAPPAGRRPLRRILAELPFVRRVLLCFTAANLFTTAVFVVMPLYTRTVLHADGSTVAALEAALGAGTLVGSFTGGRLPGTPTAVGAGCLGLMAAALALPGLPGLPAPAAGQATAVGSMAVAGWCVGVIGVRFVALFQRLVPATDRPGFFAVMQALLGATFPVSSLVFGLLGDHLSPRTLCLVQALGVLPVAAALWWTGRYAPEPAPAPAPAAQPIGDER